MAHGDYNCCAVCDSKLSYAGTDSSTKEEICAYCAVALAQVGVIARNGMELVLWIMANNLDIIQKKLKSRPIRKCFYGNEG